jgi:hypothetical protein
MTLAIDLEAPEIHLLYEYPDLPRVADVSNRLRAISDLWDACYDFENLDFRGWSPGGLILPRTTVQVKALHVGSPMWLQLVASGVGAGAGGYALRLFVRVLHDPNQLGAWLPSLVTAWHNKWADADEARVRHADARQARLRQLESDISVLASRVGAPTHIQPVGISDLDLSPPTSDAP